ncbi:sodium:solute symporter [Castellaniella sp.]|uniref:sodium:solute symporter family transporter n=1 Tax=Castellaniella sp. TaxID=1955812 RepID=UPI00355F5E26
MPGTGTALAWVILFSAGFALAGVWYARRSHDTLEDYIVARNSQSATATILTLLASSLGAWILFAPAQAATWGGLAAITGYALGAMSPRLVMIPLGQRMRELIPRGHTLTEFVMARYGRGLYGLILVIMLFYLGISITAEITAMAKIIALMAPIPLWLTAGIVLGCTLLYTAWGGLKASIFTDKIQMIIILPLLLALVVLGWQASGGMDAVRLNLQARAPQLLALDNLVGLKAGLTFFVAILLTGLFHQGNWQRVYAARSTRAMRRGFLLGGLLVGPVIFIMGLFGLVFVAQDAGSDSSVALFSVLAPRMPALFMLALIPLGLSLVMSSADTAISAVSSMIAVDARRLMPDASAAVLMHWSRLAIYVLAVPVWIASAQGYSVLYLFLLADLFCSAAAFPVFFGLYSTRCSGRVALLATLAGLAAGLWLFPAPDGPMDTLLESFLLAALVPVLVTLIFGRLWPGTRYDLHGMQDQIRSLPN